MCYTYDKLLSRTGISEVIFGYNGRDGVVTDKNGLIYMRARYYSPEMKRFINADIVAGDISNAITLNRFAYANGNPVSFVDPFGLSAERMSNSNEETFHLAIYVTEYRYNWIIKITGHTKLYFLSNNGTWYETEFTGTFPDKSSAHVSFEKCNDVPEMYDKDTNTFKEIDDLQYVVLEGNFNKSVALAQGYDSSNYGGYDFVTNNCSHYTDEILSVAEIENEHTQNYAHAGPVISIPRMRIKEVSFGQKVDTFVSEMEDTKDKIIDGWEAATIAIKVAARNAKKKIQKGLTQFGDQITFWD